MSQETDKIRANAVDTTTQADAIDQQQSVDVQQAITELETITIPTIQQAGLSATRALDTLKKSLIPQ